MDPFCHYELREYELRSRDKVFGNRSGATRLLAPGDNTSFDAGAPGVADSNKGDLLSRCRRLLDHDVATTSSTILSTKLGTSARRRGRQANKNKAAGPLETRHSPPGATASGESTTSASVTQAHRDRGHPPGPASARMHQGHKNKSTGAPDVLPIRVGTMPAMSSTTISLSSQQVKSSPRMSGSPTAATEFHDLSEEAAEAEYERRRAMVFRQAASHGRIQRRIPLSSGGVLSKFATPARRGSTPSMMKQVAAPPTTSSTSKVVPQQLISCNFAPPPRTTRGRTQPGGKKLVQHQDEVVVYKNSILQPGSASDTVVSTRAPTKGEDVEEEFHAFVDDDDLVVFQNQQCTTPIVRSGAGGGAGLFFPGGAAAAEREAAGTKQVHLVPNTCAGATAAVGSTLLSSSSRSSGSAAGREAFPVPGGDRPRHHEDPNYPPLVEVKLHEESEDDGGSGASQENHLPQHDAPQPVVILSSKKTTLSMKSIGATKTTTRSTVYERNKSWKERIDSRRRDVRLENHRKEMAKCTFTPRLHRPRTPRSTNATPRATGTSRTTSGAFFHNSCHTTTSGAPATATPEQFQQQKTMRIDLMDEEQGDLHRHGPNKHGNNYFNYKTTRATSRSTTGDADYKLVKLKTSAAARCPRPAANPRKPNANSYSSNRPVRARTAEDLFYLTAPAAGFAGRAQGGRAEFYVRQEEWQHYVEDKIDRQREKQVREMQVAEKTQEKIRREKAAVAKNGSELTVRMRKFYENNLEWARAREEKLDAQQDELYGSSRGAPQQHLHDTPLGSTAGSASSSVASYLKPKIKVLAKEQDGGRSHQINRPGEKDHKESRGKGKVPRGRRDGGIEDVADLLDGDCVVLDGEPDEAVAAAFDFSLKSSNVPPAPPSIPRQLDHFDREDELHEIMKHLTRLADSFKGGEGSSVTRTKTLGAPGRGGGQNKYVKSKLR
mmetsp:Transcript_20149/g.50857  ORF Transcript_20149/g.50857 Transcript_20149/m.50857 type:complete len:946 (+) Transcript_20149:303-3140(+)